MVHVTNFGELLTLSVATPMNVNIAAIVAGLLDVSDRWPRQLGQVDISRYLNAAVGPANPIDVRDTGLNTNPRRYEKDNGFTSAVVTSAAAAVPIWAVGVACVHNPSGVPANGRTAGNNTSIYCLMIENSTGGVVTAWLEIGGVAVTVPFHVGDNNTVVLGPEEVGMTIGSQDVNFNASVAGVIGQIFGTEA